MSLDWYDDWHRLRSFGERASENMHNSWLCFKEKYICLPMHERILDALLVAAIAYTAFYLFAEHVHLLNPEIMHVMHNMDVGFASVFIMDLGRTYMKTLHPWKFIRHHWLDITCCLVVLVGLSALFYAGFGRLSYLARVEKLHKVTKFYHLSHAGKFFL